MYNVKVSRKFEEALEKIKDHATIRRILKKVTELTNDPESKGKPLKGYWKVKFRETNIKIKLRELRIGDWRVLYFIDHEKREVWLLYVDHRHRIFKKKLSFKLP